MGRTLATIIVLATVALVAIGTLWPVPSAVAYAGAKQSTDTSSTPEGAVRRLGDQISAQSWEEAYNSLSNKAQFSESEFIHDLTGAYPNLRTYSALAGYEIQPLHASANDADFELSMHWSTVVGTIASTRNVNVVRSGDHWAINWPLTREPAVPPQVIPVNYLRWDVINRGAGDDWGAQDVEAPHVRIVDMHPVQRAEGLVILGELINEDVVPAYVSVSATLLAKDQAPIATGSSFDAILHLLLPKQVTPFLIRFSEVQLSEVASVRMTPFSTLVSASADPVIEIQNEHLTPAPDAALTGQLVNQSGQIANVAHVLGTFYDKSGQVVWVADQYVDRALLPQTPVPFIVHIPEDLARKVSTERTVVATYSFGGSV
jgi:hypothetical protein